MKLSTRLLQRYFGPPLMLMVLCGSLLAQVPNPTQQGSARPVEAARTAPVFRITVVARTIKAINYHHRTGMTKIDFQGTELMPEAKGDANVESKMGSTK